MPARVTDRDYLKQEQYRDPANLEARMSLHARFGINPLGFHRWVLSHLELPPRARILELGCGPGALWRDNLEQVPAGWHLVLSDLSAGMVQASRAALAGRPGGQFAVADAAAVGFCAECFDAVIANHMLYHLPTPQHGVDEAARVLKASGKLFTTTNGLEHLKELRELVDGFDPDPSRRLERAAAWQQLSGRFGLHNGGALLNRRFDRVERIKYRDRLEVTQAEPIVDFVASSTVFRIPRTRFPAFRSYVENKLAAMAGTFVIRKETGLFIASRPRRQVAGESLGRSEQL